MNSSFVLENIIAVGQNNSLAQCKKKCWIEVEKLQWFKGGHCGPADEFKHKQKWPCLVPFSEWMCKKLWLSLGLQMYKIMGLSRSLGLSVIHEGNFFNQWSVVTLIIRYYYVLVYSFAIVFHMFCCANHWIKSLLLSIISFGKFFFK